MELLNLVDVEKSYRTHMVLDKINLNINEKEIFGLIGKSGGGKSTLLKVIMGVAKADKGKILFREKNALHNLNYLRKNTGFATQDNMLFEELSISENSLYFGKLYGMDKKDIISNFQVLITLLSLGGFENTQIRHLSGGMIKRANLLVSLIHNPRLLILDEPTAGLDPILRKNLWNYIHRINRVGTTILVTSHLLDEIENNCNRVAILNKGKIISVASPQAYKNKYNSKDLNEVFEKVLK